MKSKLGGEAHAFTEMVDNKAKGPFVDSSPVMVGAEDRESPFAHLRKRKKPSPNSTRRAIFGGFSKIRTIASWIMFINYLARRTQRADLLRSS